MKQKKIGIVALLIITIASATAAAEEYRWNASVVIGGSRSGGDGMGAIGAEIMREFGSHLEVGFHAGAQAELSQEYTDEYGKEYHMASGYGTLVVKPKLNLGKRIEIAFPLETGNGLLQYRYSGEYREEQTWTEEILDQVNHSVYSAGIEARFLFGARGMMTVGGGYRGTGPLRTVYADRKELNGIWLRTGYSYRF